MMPEMLNDLYAARARDIDRREYPSRSQAHVDLLGRGFFAAGPRRYVDSNGVEVVLEQQWRLTIAARVIRKAGTTVETPGFSRVEDRGLRSDLDPPSCCFNRARRKYG